MSIPSQALNRAWACTPRFVLRAADSRSQEKRVQGDGRPPTGVWGHPTTSPFCIQGRHRRPERAGHLSNYQVT